MAFQVSPGINFTEADLTTIVPATAVSDGAVAGVFRWGPIDERILVDSETTLANRFGKPSNLNAETWFSAAAFLGYSNRLHVSRAANTSGLTPSVTANVVANSATVTLSTGNTANLSVGLIVISSANTIEEGATIASVVNSTAFTLSTASQAITTGNTTAIQFVSDTTYSAVANTGAVANLESQVIKNDTHFTTKVGTFDTDVMFVSRYPGDLGNSLRISVCGNSTGYTSAVNTAVFANGSAQPAGSRILFTIDSGGNTGTYAITAANSTVATTLSTDHRARFDVTDRIEVGNTFLGTQFLKITEIGDATNFGTINVTFNITANTTSTLVTSNNTTDLAAQMIIVSGNNSSLVGLVVNNVVNSTAFFVKSVPSVDVTANGATFSPRAIFTVEFEDNYTLAEAFTFDSSNTSTQVIDRYWEFFNLIDTAPGQSEYVANFGNSSINSDELHIVVVDEDGKISGVPGTVLETYDSLSRATDAKTIDGGANYWKDVINDASEYVYAVNELSGLASNTALNLANSTLDVVSYDFKLGRDGQDEATIPLGLITSAYDVFASAEEVDISLIIQGRARTFQLANYLIDNIAEKRKDCVVFVSPQKADIVNNVGNEAASIVTFRNSLRSSSYGVLDSGYKYMYDRYNDIYRYIPLNGDIAGLCARTDQTNDPWFSPAGYNRGQVRNIVKLAYNPKKADRDTLYKAGANPVISEPGQGTIMFGDKTLLAKPSAFDRINVRRLFIVLEKAISTAAKFTLFEFNDEFTRSQFKNLVNPYLRDVKGRRGVTDFQIVCDETNNTAEVIDRNEFVGDIYIKPSRAINYIQLNFVAVRSGVAFSEVVGRF